MDWTNAVLPQAVMLPMWVKLSWALVASAAVLRLMQGFQYKLWIAVLCALLMLMPRIDVLSGYLALAFQTPSLVLVVWGFWRWIDAMQHRAPEVSTPVPVAFVGVLLGWALAIDAFNAWPSFLNLQLYALGFTSVGLWLVLGMLVALTLWKQVVVRWTLSMAAVLVVYVLLRLPTGNVWDALLDPFVWLALHAQLWRAWRTPRADI
jgi:hypothetical protein